jgi:hypothetical protein
MVNAKKRSAFDEMDHRKIPLFSTIYKAGRAACPADITVLFP